MTFERPDTRPTHGWGQTRDLKKAEESMRGEVPKPYSVPEGYVPPTMMEQWRYAQRRFADLCLLSSQYRHLAQCPGGVIQGPLTPTGVCPQGHSCVSCAGILIRSMGMGWCLSWGSAPMQCTPLTRQGSAPVAVVQSPQQC